MKNKYIATLMLLAFGITGVTSCDGNSGGGIEIGKSLTQEKFLEAYRSKVENDTNEYTSLKLNGSQAIDMTVSMGEISQKTKNDMTLTQLIDIDAEDPYFFVEIDNNMVAPGVSGITTTVNEYTSQELIHINDKYYEYTYRQVGDEENLYEDELTLEEFQDQIDATAKFGFKNILEQSSEEYFLQILTIAKDPQFFESKNDGLVLKASVPMDLLFPQEQMPIPIDGFASAEIEINEFGLIEKTLVDGEMEIIEEGVKMKMDLYSSTVFEYNAEIEHKIRTKLN